MLIFLELSKLSETEVNYFELIYQSEVKRMWLLCNDILKNKDLAQDTVQIAFEKIIGKLSLLQKFEDWDKVKGYVYIVTRNTAFDMLKRNKYYSYLNIDDFHENYADKNADTELKAIKKIDFENLSELISLIKSEYKEAIYLRYCLELKYQEIADITHTTSANARYRVKSGMIKVRQLAKERGVTNE